MNDRELLAQVRRIQVRTNRLVTDVMSGGYTSVFRGAGIEFDEVREFVEGDDLRSIDWNVTARTGRPHIKKFMEERELTILLVLDLSPSMRFGTVTQPGKERPRSVRDAAAELVACMALAAARNNDKAGLVAFSERVELYVPARKGVQHVTRLIREALGFTPQGGGSGLAAALQFAARVQRKRAVVFVISDFLGEGYAKALALLARRHDVIAVAIGDPATLALPAAGLLLLRDLETGASRWIDAGAAKVRREHARRVAAWRAALEDTLRRARVDLMEVRTDRSVADAIVKFFRMRELRGARG